MKVSVGMVTVMSMHSHSLPIWSITSEKMGGLIRQMIR